MRVHGARAGASVPARARAPRSAFLGWRFANGNNPFGAAELSAPFVNGGIGLGSAVQLMAEWSPEQQFDSNGFVDLLRTTSIYRRLETSTRESLLDAIAERIRTAMGDRATHRYLTVMRIGQRAT